ncbi:hypothetical protein [Rubeoparvulum massiliense]|uniref:hypothetical protein n=1 Tax=Rubeoparvulum massiliense TaxID=1631346 RepID=UPI00065DE546|nr:hypothetical protein [Rubeoparvulum massiliense]
MDWILQNKWFFFISGEIIFWLSILGFLIGRYWFGWRRGSWAFLLIFILSDLWLFLLGWFDFRNTGKIETFQIIIVIVLIYAVTSGRKDIQRLDRWVARRLAIWRGEPIPTFAMKKEADYGIIYAMKNGKNFLVHLGLYVTIMLILYTQLGLMDEQAISDTYTGPIWFRYLQAGLFPHEQAQQVAQLWTFILGIDAIITISYFIWPKKRKTA